MRLLKRCVTKQDKELDGQDENTKYDVWYEIEASKAIEKLDKNICLFLNELTGFGHLYSDEAIA